MPEQYKKGQILWTTGYQRSLGSGYEQYFNEPVEVREDTPQGESWTHVIFLHGYPEQRERPLHERAQYPDATYYWHHNELSSQRPSTQS